MPSHPGSMTDDAMVPIATLYNRGEALSVAAMLDAAGVIVHVGGEHYGGVTLEILAIGGFRLTVPAFQHGEASDILRLFANAPARFSYRLRRRLLALLAVVGVTVSIPSAYLYYRADGSPGLALLALLSLSTTPVPPQARGEYHLAPGGD